MGRVSWAIQGRAHMTGEAVISPCGRYRYLLTRQIGRGAKAAIFIMLNPSTADATADDPTIRRCMGFARRWRCGVVRVVNLFAVRATDHAAIRVVDDPVGPDNPDWIERAVRVTRHRNLVVCAWGIHGTYLGQDRAVLDRLNARSIRPIALGVTRHGHPRHPLYLPYTARLVPFAKETNICP